jgi:putative exosortase-associated protein (TIGR04073 family)
VSWLAAVVLLTLALPAQMGMGAVYNAPYYQSNQDCGGSACGGSGCGSCWGDSPATKLGRGITNAVTGWLEIPKHTLVGTFNCNVNPLEGLAVGFIRGTGRAIERTGVGIYEAVTFPLPGFGPLLCPEYVSLEPNCMNWRYGNYYGATLCQPCIPCDPCGSYGGPPAAPYGGGQPQMAPPRPAPSQPQAAAPGAGPGTSLPGGTAAPSATYPDDYLK